MARLAILILALALGGTTASAQQILGQWQCTAYLGNVPITGIYQIEWWSYTQLYRHRGHFQHPQGAIYDFEVETASMAGRGGLWVNGQRHHESHIDFQAVQGGFVFRTEDNLVIEGKCQ